uniref:Suppressor of tumorigenicity 7 protein homolog n=1 Tax=Phallusia mammillata TaxID=59560 RepID=A0A6F9DU12_9ASCI|nr:suppressor of tumorigenicity 7 protein homolog [Phallusia mammillata]
MFELLSNLPGGYNGQSDDEILCHFTVLKAELTHYFPDVDCCPCITNPFSVDPADLPVGTGEQEQLIDIQADDTTQAMHKEYSPTVFWLNMASSYPTLAGRATPQLLIFPSTWECEQGFSSMMNIKTKSRNRLTSPGHYFRCAVSKVVPRIDRLVEGKQIQIAH